MKKICEVKTRKFFAVNKVFVSLCARLWSPNEEAKENKNGRKRITKEKTFLVNTNKVNYSKIHSFIDSNKNTRWKKGLKAIFLGASGNWIIVEILAIFSFILFLFCVITKTRRRELRKISQIQMSYLLRLCVGVGRKKKLGSAKKKKENCEKKEENLSWCWKKSYIKCLNQGSLGCSLFDR